MIIDQRLCARAQPLALDHERVELGRALERPELRLLTARRCPTACFASGTRVTPVKVFKPRLWLGEGELIESVRSLIGQRGVRKHNALAVERLQAWQHAAHRGAVRRVLAHGVAFLTAPDL